MNVADPFPRDDAIRIVPLHTPEAEAPPAAPPASAPHLTYRGGSLLTSVEVVTVFWGSAWQSSPLSDTEEKLKAFFDAILSSTMIDVLGEYDVPGQSIGRGRRAATAVVTVPEPGTSTDDASIQTLLEDNTGPSGLLPPPSANGLYVVFLPPNVPVSMGGDLSCTAFCGYHDAIREGFYYAVLPYPDCSGCTAGRSPFDALTITASHELCEAITDPVPGQGWYDDSNGEIGDICAWQTGTVAGYTVQLEWSNRQGACNGSGAASAG
jgi:hypothetical protein